MIKKGILFAVLFSTLLSACVGGKTIPIVSTIIIDVSARDDRTKLIEILKSQAEDRGWIFVDVSDRQSKVDHGKSSIYAAIYSTSGGREFPELVAYDLDAVGRPKIMLSDGPDKQRSHRFQSSLVTDIKSRWPRAKIFGAQLTGRAGG